MALNISKLYVFSISVAVFSSLAVPSLKIFYSSSALNFLPLIMFMIGILSSSGLKLRRVQILILSLWSIFFVILAQTIISSEFFISSEDFIKTIVLYLLGFLSIITANYSSFCRATFIFFCWGTFLAILQLTIGINLSRDMGQHYLTLSFPIGCSAFYASRFFFVYRDSKKLRLLYALCFFLNFAAIGTLLARSPIVFAGIFAIFLVFALFVLSKTVFSALKVLFFTSLVSIIFLLLIQFLFNNEIMSLRQMARLDLSSAGASDESRLQLYYLPALEFFIQRPLLGWGLGSSDFLFGSYPHNIFLEVLTIGGLLLFTPFLMLLMFFLKNLFVVLRSRPLIGELMGGLGVLLYAFFQFNTSFDLLSSYILMVPLLSFVSLDLRSELKDGYRR